MKRFILTLCVIGLLCVQNSKAQETHDAGQIAINGGISYGFDFEELGIRGGATYFINENMRVGGDLTYWFLESFEGISQTALEINGNFHYILYDDNDLMFYGIGTLGIHYYKFEYDMDFGDFGDFGSASDSDAELGFGLGIGGEYNLGSVSIFAEQKFMLNGFDQPKFNIGIRFYL